MFTQIVARFNMTAEKRKLIAEVASLIGPALFGLGWGLGGFCPGPAIASLSVAALTSGAPQVILFVLAMLLGMTLHDRLWSRHP